MVALLAAVASPAISVLAQENLVAANTTAVLAVVLMKLLADIVVVAGKLVAGKVPLVALEPVLAIAAVVGLVAVALVKLQAVGEALDARAEGWPPPVLPQSPMFPNPEKVRENQEIDCLCFPKANL